MNSCLAFVVCAEMCFSIEVNKKQCRFMDGTDTTQINQSRSFTADSNKAIGGRAWLPVDLAQPQLE